MSRHDHTPPDLPPPQRGRAFRAPDALFPKLPASTVTVSDGNDGILFLVPEKPDWILVNKNLASVLLLCDGKNSLDDIRGKIGNHVNASEAIERIGEIANRGFFDEAAERADGGEPLVSLHLNMTDRCNLHCVYCYADDRKKTETLLSYGDYVALIDDAAAMNPDVLVTFTGGEPLLNGDTLALGEHCRSRGIGTFLLTNGLLVDESNCGRVADCFDAIRVSVDGTTARTHDRLRGAGSHGKAMAAISLLESRGAPPDIAMTVTSLNLGEIQDMARRYGSRLVFQPLYDVGNARGRGIGVDGTTYYEALRSASGVEPYAQLGRRLAAMRNRGCAKCSMGDGELSVSPSGDVYPCHMLHVERFRAGNVKASRLHDIYWKSDVLKQIRSLSVRTREGCRECPVRLLCGGGCWARSFHAHGTLNAPDDFCDYDLAAFRQGLLSSSRLPEEGE